MSEDKEDSREGIIVQVQEQDVVYDPINRALDDIDWKSTGLTKDDERDGLPVVTHEGYLTIGDLLLHVFQLSNGMRVIPEDDLMRFLKLMQ